MKPFIFITISPRKIYVNDRQGEVKNVDDLKYIVLFKLYDETNKEFIMGDYEIFQVNNNRFVKDEIMQEYLSDQDVVEQIQWSQKNLDQGNRLKPIISRNFVFYGIDMKLCREVIITLNGVQISKYFLEKLLEQEDKSGQSSILSKIIRDEKGNIVSKDKEVLLLKFSKVTDSVTLDSMWMSPFQIITYLPLPFKKDGEYTKVPVEKVVEKIEKEMFQIEDIYKKPKKDVLLKIFYPQVYKRNDRHKLYSVMDDWFREVVLKKEQEEKEKKNEMQFDENLQIESNVMKKEEIVDIRKNKKDKLFEDTESDNEYNENEEEGLFENEEEETVPSEEKEEDKDEDLFEKDLFDGLI